MVEQLVRPTLEAGRPVVIMAEEWHTAEAICRISDRLWCAGLRDQVVLLWNASGTMGLHTLDWPRLRLSTTITTVSRYMKHLLWSYGVDPLVVPNGIPRRLLDTVDDDAVGLVRQVLGQGPVLLKVAGWDPDKRWRFAMEARRTCSCLHTMPVAWAWRSRRLASATCSTS